MKRTLLFMLLIGTIGACIRNEKMEVAQTPLVETKSIVTLPEASVTKTPQPSNQVGLIKEFQNQYEPEEQVFKVDLAETREIVGEKGTRITIPQGSIVSAFDQVEIHLDEAYSTIDMLKYQLTTTSNGQPIVSKGMIKLTCNDPLATINPNIPIEVKFPSNDKETACDYFKGEQLSDGSINWVPQNQVTKVNITSELQPELLYTNNNGKGLANNIDNISTLTLNEYNVANSSLENKILISPINAIDVHSAFCLDISNEFSSFENMGFFPKSIFDKVIIKADVNVSGKLSNVEIKKSIHKSIDTLVYNAVIKSNPWVPMRQSKNSFSKSTVHIIVHFISDSRGRLHAKRPFVMTSTNMRKAIYNEWLKVLSVYKGEKYIDPDSVNQSSKMLRGYNFNISNFGWINCDYFPTYTPQVCFNIKHKDQDVLKHIIVYKNEKRILNVNGYNSIIVAKKPFDVIVLRKKDDNFYFTITGSDQIKNGNMIENSKAYSMDELQIYCQLNYN